MICLSHTTGYALRALACLENIDRRPSFIRDVAESTGVPRPYLARIINRLSHKGIVSAKRGYHGGVTLTRPAREVTLLEVVEAIEGEEWIGPCLLGMGACQTGSICPTQDFWNEMRDQIKARLAQTTLADLIAAPAARCGAKNKGASPSLPGLPQPEPGRNMARPRPSPSCQTCRPS